MSEAQFIPDIEWARGNAGPLMTQALSLYKAETDFNAKRRLYELLMRDGVETEINTRIMRAQILRIEGAISSIYPDHIYPCARMRQRAIRVYAAAIEEAYLSLPFDTAKPRFFLKALAVSAHLEAPAVTKEPHEYFGAWLELVNRLAMQYHQYQYDRYRNAQRQRSAQGAAARWSERGSINQILTNLAKRRDVLGDPAPAKELWPEFYAALEEDGLTPSESGDRISWCGNPKGMTLKTFTNRLSKVRNK